VLHGVVVKAYSSYYYVQTGEKVIMCTLRGRFKKERFILLVGDEVEYDITGEGKGVIEEMLPRHSMMKRPMVANVDQAVLTFAIVNPDINPSLIDKFLVLAESSGLKIIICINKIDLADTAELIPLTERYRSIGYSVVTVSATTGVGIDKLRDLLYERITVFAGPSGVGKSSILNAIQPGLSLTTGEVSQKIGRGKHTTRYAELMPLAGGGFLVDTPGFSLTEFADVAEADLAYFFPDLAAVAGDCKFSTCLHVREPQCAVKQAVIDGKVSPERYNSYVDILNEIRQNKKGF
jgi:ribosome biogenesis GTPase